MFVDTASPVLNNPPAFVLLAIVIGLAAYLRQLGEKRNDEIDKIRSGKNDDYPIGLRHTNDRIDYLTRSRDRLNQVAPTFIWFTIFVCIRFLGLTIARLVDPTNPNLWGLAFRIFDVAIAGVLLVLVVALYVMHRIATGEEQKIRLTMEGWREARLEEQRKKEVQIPAGSS